MKRMMTLIVAVVLVAGIGTTVALAKGGMGRNYVDANRDGVCDYYGTGCGRNFVDADGDGICDRCETGRNYVDANGDGVCDHYSTGCGRHCRRA